MLAKSDRVWGAVVVLAAVFVLNGCAGSVPKDALQLAPDALEHRQLQTRRFSTGDERALLGAVAGFLQDHGYTLEESEVALGVLVASKDRDATAAGQVVLGLLFGVPWDKNEKIRASVVTRSHGTGAANTLVRVTFQRIVWDTQGRITRMEPVVDEEIYAEFFQSLGKAVFLEAHEI